MPQAGNQVSGSSPVATYATHLFVESQHGAHQFSGVGLYQDVAQQAVLGLEKFCVVRQWPAELEAESVGVEAPHITDSHGVAHHR